MNKISIPVNRAYDAIRWASEHFTQFDVQHMMPADKYEFRFECPEQASFFALRWQWLEFADIGNLVKDSASGKI